MNNTYQNRTMRQMCGLHLHRGCPQEERDRCRSALESVPHNSSEFSIEEEHAAEQFQDTSASTWRTKDYR